MPKYLILKHYRGAPATVNDAPMDQWAPEEVDAHMAFMADFGQRLEDNGELVDAQALSQEGAFVREGRTSERIAVGLTSKRGRASIGIAAGADPVVSDG